MATKTNDHERRVTIPKDIWTGLTYMVNDQKVGLDPAAADTITQDALCFSILRQVLKEKGHYPNKVKESEGEAG